MENEDYGAAAVVYFDKAHDGPGWYFYDLAYPKEGSCGAFKTREEACDFAEENGYIIYPSRTTPKTDRK